MASVLPSSQTSTSNASRASVWRSTSRSRLASGPARLYVATTSEMRGFIPLPTLASGSLPPPRASSHDGAGRTTTASRRPAAARMRAPGETAGGACTRRSPPKTRRGSALRRSPARVAPRRVSAGPPRRRRPAPRTRRALTGTARATRRRRAAARTSRRRSPVTTSCGSQRRSKSSLPAFQRDCCTREAWNDVGMAEVTNASGANRTGTPAARSCRWYSVSSVKEKCAPPMAIEEPALDREAAARGSRRRGRAHPCPMVGPC